MQVISGLSSLMANFRGRELDALKASDTSVVVGYQGVNYAVHVHENKTMRHEPPTKAKFLEDPARELNNSGELRRIVSGAARSGASLTQALIIAAQRIQRESMLQVPVDTGNLKGSAFTKAE